MEKVLFQIHQYNRYYIEMTWIKDHSFAYYPTKITVALFGQGTFEFPVGQRWRKISFLYSLSFLSLYCISSKISTNYFFFINFTNEYEVFMSLIFISSSFMSTVIFIALSWFRIWVSLNEFCNYRK